MSENVTAVAAVISAGLTVLLAYLMGRLGTTAIQSNEKLNALAVVAKDTHTLVNSNMGTTLKTCAIALARLAEETGNEEDKKAAEAAKLALAEHEAKQKIVDTEDMKAAEAGKIALAQHESKEIEEAKELLAGYEEKNLKRND